MRNKIDLVFIICFLHLYTDSLLADYYQYDFWRIFFTPLSCHRICPDSTYVRDNNFLSTMSENYGYRRGKNNLIGIGY
jgi:hypothetical protein